MTRVKYKHENHADTNREAGLLWEDITDLELSRVDRFHPKIVHREKSVLFGYADVTIVVETKRGVLFPIKLRGLVVKSLKGKPHVDMPAEKGADGEFYDQFMPRSSALRTVITSFIHSDPEVQATVAASAEAPIEGPASTSAAGTTPEPGDEPELRGDNPFAPPAE